jgi:hypothetical protein
MTESTTQSHAHKHDGSCATDKHAHKQEGSCSTDKAQKTQAEKESCGTQHKQGSCGGKK